MSALGTLGSVVLGAGDAEISLDQSTNNTLTFSQLSTAVLLAQPANNTFNFNQLATAFTNRTGLASNTLALNQSAYRVQIESASNTLTLTGSSFTLRFKIVNTNNTFTLTQSTTALGTYSKLIFQTIIFGNQATYTINRLVNLSNNFNLNNAVVGFAARGASNNLIFSQLVVAFIAKKATNFLEFGQITKLNISVNRPIFSSFEMIGRAVSGPNTIRRSLTQFFAPFSVAIGFAVKGVEQEITFNQSLTGYAAKKAANNFPVQQLARYNALFNVKGLSKLTLIQRATVKLVKFISATSVVGFEQQTRRTKVVFATTSNNLSLSQNLVRVRHHASASNILAFSQTTTKSKVAFPKASSIFAPIQLLNRIVTFNRAASNILVFLRQHEQFINIGSTTYLSVDNAIGALVRPFIILQGLNHTVVMPRPEFDDSEAFGGSMVILRSKTNVRRVYKKGTNKATLNYTFIITRSKRDELKTFIRIYNSLPFYLENHKAERWYVTFKSNPFTFTEESLWQDCGRFTINLEFEGVRLS